MKFFRTVCLAEEESCEHDQPVFGTGQRDDLHCLELLCFRLFSEQKCDNMERASTFERCALEESFVRRYASSLFAISVRLSVNDLVSKIIQT